MSITFLVALDEDSSDPSQLLEIASEIQEALEAKGLLVQSVAPWARPTASPAGGFQSITGV